ncbi:hypothetical protein C8J56DRAFT_942704 [Mycena floridula]|nr:hypothetical protein C8J56DRAFT_942704 [Mycena floridula]
MPSFSLVRSFRKRRQSASHSQSSNLLDKEKNHEAPTNSTMESTSHDLSVRLIQHLEGVSIGNINAPMLSNNHININYYGTRLQENSFAVLQLGDIFLEEELLVSEYPNNTLKTSRYRGRIIASPSANMSIWSYQGSSADQEFEDKYRIYSSLPRHPNILQLYGVCRSPFLTALIFHGGGPLSRTVEHHESLPPSEYVAYYIAVIHQYKSAQTMLRQHGLRNGLGLTFSDVDERGNLIVSHFLEGESDIPDHDPHILKAFETNSFIKEDLLKYYQFVWRAWFFGDSYVYSSSTSDFTTSFQVFHPEINLPAYCLPTDKFVFAQGGMHTMVTKDGIELTLLNDLCIRCRIPTSHIPIFSINESIYSISVSFSRRFATWAAQANYLIRDLPINMIEDIQTSLWEVNARFFCLAEPVEGWQRGTDCRTVNELLVSECLYLFCRPRLEDSFSIHWSRDDLGKDIIEDPLIQQAFGITVGRFGCVRDEYTISPAIYSVLEGIHKSCGFNPYGTEMTEYLGLPVAVALETRNSGLEECSDIEADNQEIASESDSGDSDYASAAEDA